MKKLSVCLSYSQRTASLLHRLDNSAQRLMPMHLLTSKAVERCRKTSKRLFFYAFLSKGNEGLASPGCRVDFQGNSLI
ncbi:MAG: hypothetical protein KH037_02930 [Burkholderiales bacterium]|nr:hypothetical protein [Burkholderiales bacterium]